MTMTAALGIAGLATTAEPALRDHEGAAVVWTDWLAERAPAAVVVYASWAPRADGVLASLADLESAARARGLRLVLLAVQEPFEDSRVTLESVDVEWIHDRHGVLLKRYRVLRVPSMLVIGSDGDLVATLDVDAGKLQSVAVP
jgi:hypothetical protein